MHAGSTIRTVGLAFLLAAAQSPAWSQQRAPASGDLAGEWRLQTAGYDGGTCSIAGDITLRAAPSGGYLCNFVSLETCAGHTHKVKQSCLATESAGDILILSRVEKILDATPPEQRDWLMRTESYRADNFRVRRKGQDTLEGQFFSDGTVAFVRFTRSVERLS